MAGQATQNTTATRQAAANELTGGVRKMSRSVGGPYALMRCKDCGALGCLIPVVHGSADPRLEGGGLAGVAAEQLAQSVQ